LNNVQKICGVSRQTTVVRQSFHTHKKGKTTAGYGR